MCFPGKVEHSSDRDVPRFFQLNYILGGQVPENRSIKVSVIDLVHFCSCPWMSKIKLLQDVIVPVNESSSLVPDILTSDIPTNNTYNSIAQVFTSLYPGELIATQYHWADHPVPLQEGQTPGLTFPGVLVSGESESVFFSLNLTNCQH